MRAGLFSYPAKAGRLQCKGWLADAGPSSISDSGELQPKTAEKNAGRFGLDQQ